MDTWPAEICLPGVRSHIVALACFDMRRMCESPYMVYKYVAYSYLEPTVFVLDFGVWTLQNQIFLNQNSGLWRSFGAHHFAKILIHSALLDLTSRQKGRLKQVAAGTSRLCPSASRFHVFFVETWQLGMESFKHFGLKLATLHPNLSHHTCAVQVNKNQQTKPTKIYSSWKVHGTVPTYWFIRTLY